MENQVEDQMGVNNQEQAKREQNTQLNDDQDELSDIDIEVDKDSEVILEEL